MLETQIQFQLYCSISSSSSSCPALFWSVKMSLCVPQTDTVWHVNLKSWKPAGQRNHPSSHTNPVLQSAPDSCSLTAVCVWEGFAGKQSRGWRSEWLACISSPLTERLTMNVSPLHPHLFSSVEVKCRTAYGIFRVGGRVGGWGDFFTYISVVYECTRPILKSYS